MLRGMLLILRCSSAYIVIFWADAEQVVRAGPVDDSVVFGQSTAITDLGPAYGAFHSYPAGYEASFAIYDRLICFDAQLQLRPQLAERWETAADQRSITFFLRPRAVFHDGTPVNAAAVKFNVERMLDKRINTTNRPLWDPISSADVLGEHVVRINTSKPFALLLHTLAHGSAGLVSPAAIEKYGQESMAHRPVGAGPYRLGKLTPGQQLVLEAFDGYWGGKPLARRLIFRYIPEASTRIAALRTGAVDIIDAVPVHMLASLGRDPRFQVLSRSGLRPMGLAMRCNRPPFDDLRVRHALNHAVPVELIAERLFMGYAQAADSPLAFRTIGYIRVGGFDYSPAKARALLVAAGFGKLNADGVLERDGKPLHVRLLTSDGVFPKDLLTSEIAARALQKVGVRVTILKIEKGSYWDALRGTSSELMWDLALFGFNPSNASGLYHLSSMFQSNLDDAGRPDVWNIARFRSAEVDGLLAKASETIDFSQRRRLLGRAQSVIWNDAPFVWLQVNDVVSAARRELRDAEVWPIAFTITRNAHY